MLRYRPSQKVYWRRKFSRHSSRVLWNMNVENICGGHLAVWFYQHAAVRICGREHRRNCQLHDGSLVDSTVDFCEHAQFWPVKKSHVCKSWSEMFQYILLCMQRGSHFGSLLVRETYCLVSFCFLLFKWMVWFCWNNVNVLVKMGSCLNALNHQLLYFREWCRLCSLSVVLI